MMKSKCVWACVLGAFLMAFPAAASAQDGTVTYVAILTGSGEPAAVVTAAFGDFTLTVDNRTNRGDFVLRLWNIPATITGAHIHLGVAAVNGPVIISLNPPGGLAGDVQLRGSIDLSAGLTAQPTRGLVDVRDLLQILAAHPEMLYANVHTTGNPGGEIRGQLTLNR